MSKKLISVIVLTYEKFNDLNKNLNSIYKQTYPNIEIIVSDDGSKNFNEDLIKKLFEKKTSNIKNIRLLRNIENKGTVKNFNEAIKNANGDIIVPLSCDDEFENANVICEIEAGFKDNINIVTGIRKIINLSNKETIELPTKRDRFKLKSKNLLDYLIYRGNFISGASTSYRKSYLIENLYFNEEYKLLEDFPFYIKALRAGEKIYFLQNYKVKYKLGGVSTNKSKVNQLLLEDFIKFYKSEYDLSKGYRKRFLSYILDIKKQKSLIKIFFKYPDVITLKIICKIFRFKII